MVVDGARALYTSQVVALSTAGLAAFLVTFAGFYLTSNTLRRDLLARTGGIIAATPVGSGTYLAGKWLGGSAYLGLVTGAYLLNVMAMFLIRGEGPLEPLTFVLTYLLALGPGILVVAALALCFECVPALSGRLGDVAYFFVWTVFVAMGAIGEARGGGMVLDVMGIGFILAQVHSVSAAQNIAIGVTPFDPRLAAWVLPPMSLTAAILLPRFITALLAVPILLVARLFFHRFDPARARSASQATSGQLIRQVSLLVKPLTRVVADAGARLVPAAPGALRPVLAETVMTLCQSPLVLLAWLGVLAATVVATDATAHRTLPLRRVRPPRRGAGRSLHPGPRGRHAGDALQHAEGEAGLRADQARRRPAARAPLLPAASAPDRPRRPGRGPLAADRRGIHGGARHGARPPDPHAEDLHGGLPPLPLHGA